ncbi:acid-sensing ion channel 1C-like isoform X2 [Watersipora subatra]|uniref:acid-sensing ion channel 1C-like isoform X2 n=1 Tax=Watersipora subatra TaxID=2589382 RepID=UPI00355B8EFB
MGSLAMLIVTARRQIIYFLERDHATKYDVNFVHQLEFPAITICNVNRHRRSAMTIKDIAIMGAQLGFTDDHHNLLHPELYPEDWYNETFLMTDWEAVHNSITEDDFDLADFYARTGHRLEDLVQMCSWKSQKCNTSSWVVEYTHYGKCYTFNKFADHQLQKAGSGNGLYLVLYDEEIEYIETKNTDDLGIKFLPHAQHEPPFLKELGFGFAPGFHYLVTLKQKEITALPLPYGVCEQDHPTQYFQNYTVPGCRIECETERIYEKCNCRLVESPGDHPLCTPHQFECAEEMLEQSNDCLCQNPCHAVQYPYAMSLLEIRETTIDKLRKDHPIPPELNTDNIIVLNIYFDSLSFETVTQVPAYTFNSIISDLGGAMGLWLGASILAAAQMLDYCGRMCHARFISKASCCNPTEVDDIKPTAVQAEKREDIVSVWATPRNLSQSASDLKEEDISDVD